MHIVDIYLCLSSLHEAFLGLWSSFEILSFALSQATGLFRAPQAPGKADGPGLSQPVHSISLNHSPLISLNQGSEVSTGSKSVQSVNPRSSVGPTGKEAEGSEAPRLEQLQWRCWPWSEDNLGEQKREMGRNGVLVIPSEPLHQTALLTLSTFHRD